MAIETPRQLQAHLQSAIEVELSTIPPYLYAMYSMTDATSKSYKLIQSVVVEEMLHLALAANVLIAVGGTPRFYDEDVLPPIPRRYRIDNQNYNSHWSGVRKKSLDVSSRPSNGHGLSRVYRREPTTRPSGSSIGLSTGPSASSATDIHCSKRAEWKAR